MHPQFGGVSQKETLAKPPLWLHDWVGVVGGVDRSWVCTEEMKECWME